jgi:hypothetical protein
MIQAIRLVITPSQTWERITSARRSPLRILAFYVLPLLLVGLALEGYSLVRWGEKRGDFGYLAKISEFEAVRYSVVQLALMLVSIVIAAKCVQWVAHSSQVRSAYWQCFMLIAYGFTPMVLARYLDAIPAINTWLCWTAGALLALSVLYHGVALALKPDQTKGFGLYLVSVMLVLLLSGLSHFIASAVLHGKFPAFLRS